MAVMSIVLATVIALSATFAWLTSATSRVNHFESKGYAISDESVVVNETFEPPEDWEVGQEITKQISVTNAGSTSVLARVSFEEILKKLGADGAVEYLEYNTGASTAGLTPAYIDIAAYSDSGEWKTPSNIYVGSYAPSNLVVRISTKGDAVVAWVPYTDDATQRYQSVKLGTVTVATDKNTITLSTNVGLGYWTEGEQEYFTWAGKNLNTTSTEPNFAQAFTDASPWSEQIPTASDTAHSALEALITYTFGAEINNTSPTANKWYYNPADGYFYYAGVIAPGASTPNLLEAVTLGAGLGNAFLQFDYDLSVTVESIQAFKEAVITDTNGGGWATTGDLKTFFLNLSSLPYRVEP
jgi:hypothetical protein